MEALIAFLGAKKTELAAGSIGGLLSLRFLNIDKEKKGFAAFYERVSLAGSGLAVAYFGTPMVAEYWTLADSGKGVVALVLSAYGVSAMMSANKRIEPIFDYLQAKLLGGSSDVQS